MASIPQLGTPSQTYVIWEPYQGQSEEDGRTVRAGDVRDAVCEWARRDDWDSNDYRMAKGMECLVNVRMPDSTVEQWTVSGESVIEYTARKQP